MFFLSECFVALPCVSLPVPPPQQVRDQSLDNVSRWNLPGPTLIIKPEKLHLLTSLPASVSLYSQTLGRVKLPRISLSLSCSRVPRNSRINFASFTWDLKLFYAFFIAGSLLSP